MKERIESDKYKQWDGRVWGNYLPESWACCQKAACHPFRSGPDSLAGVGGGEDSERCERVCSDQMLRTGSRNGNALEELEHLKVLNLGSQRGDAEQNWGFIQNVEAKQIPHHGPLQTWTDLGLPPGEDIFSVTFFC